MSRDGETSSRGVKEEGEIAQDDTVSNWTFYFIIIPYYGQCNKSYNLAITIMTVFVIYCRILQL